MNNKLCGSWERKYHMPFLKKYYAFTGNNASGDEFTIPVSRPWLACQFSREMGVWDVAAPSTNHWHFSDDFHRPDPSHSHLGALDHTHRERGPLPLYSPSTRLSNSRAPQRQIWNLIFALRGILSQWDQGLRARRQSSTHNVTHDRMFFFINSPKIFLYL